MAAARATLAVMEAEDVRGRARRAGARLAAGLAALPGVTAVRGAGLLLAPQLDGARAKDGGRGLEPAACWSTPCGPTPSAWRHRSW